jgi:hypothetical protein
MDKRHGRRAASRLAIKSAIERLKNGLGTHPRHVAVMVRLTKQAVAKEAGVSPATLYRFPELVKLIGEVTKGELPKASASEQRRLKLVQRIDELERENAALIAENLRLSRELAGAGVNPDAPNVSTIVGRIARKESHNRRG